MARLLIHNGVTNMHLLSDAAGPLQCFREIPLGTSEWLTLADTYFVRATHDGTGWTFATNNVFVAHTNASVTVEIARPLANLTDQGQTAAVFTHLELPPAEGTYLGVRAQLVASLMLLGCVLFLCYQSGRRSAAR